jgi:hypothetical protein
MKGERKLYLVRTPPATTPGGDGGGPGTGEDRRPPGALGSDEPPFSEEELREAAALRERLERGAEPLAEGLRAAFRPASLDRDDGEALLHHALGDESAATRAERLAADELRDALADPAALGAGGDRPPDVALAGALRAAFRPAPLDPARNEALLARALRPARPIRRILPFTMAALGSVAAMAAGVALMMSREPPRGGATAAEAAQASPSPAATATASAPAPPPVAVAAVSPESPRDAMIRAQLIRARSAASLFDAKSFAAAGESGRIDRIASARASDLRENRFAAWGVR